jgi:glucose/arabinose dehydrogenase
MSLRAGVGMKGRRTSGYPVRCMIAVLIGVAIVAASPLFGSLSTSAAVPGGFSDTLVTAVSAPTDIAFTPSGTMLITSQGGRLYARSGGTTTLVLNISSKVCSDFERGLLGLAVDPEFNSNNYIYLFYTFNKNGTCAHNVPSSPVNRVSRFTFSGSTVSGETILVDNMPSPNGNHNAGGLVFGKDGYLYIAIGDGGCEIGSPSECAGANDNARVKNRLQGKILRVNRNGVAPSSNPFYDGGGTCRVNGSTSAGLHCRETFAWGFRNPFRIAVNPNSSSTVLHANDVGQGLWEEIDRVLAGRDYGWNSCEGFHANGSYNPCGFTDENPIFEYGHGSCNSITGAAFIPNGSWPSTYDNAYFFSDYTCGTIWYLKNGTRTTFATGVGSATEIEFGPSGADVALYYTNYGSGQIRRIDYTAANNRAPVAEIDASPTYGPLPLEVDFDGTGSSDPDGDTLTYKWDFGDGTSSTSSSPTKTYQNAQKYKVTLTVSDGRGGIGTDSVTIDAGNTRPDAEILSPSASDEFAVGETITLTGKGTDAEDGNLSSSRMTWEVLLHHGSHTHPFFGPTPGNNLTFKAPAPEDLAAAANSYLEIRLTVRDSNGLGKRVTLNYQPNKVDVQIDSNVPGMLLWVEGVAVTAPATVTSWENNPLSVMAPDQIGPDDQPYIYKSWSDGGTRSHNYDTPASNGTVIATFNVLPGDSIAPHADARVSEAYPTRNEGGGTGLSVKGGTSSDYETVIRFKVANVGESVYRARLFLFAYDPTVDGPSIYETSPSWSELGVTWNNRPAPTGSALQNYGPVADNSWIAYDVTAAIDGNGYVAFVLRGTSSDGVSWYSRQAGAHQPRLVIWSSVPSPSEATPETTATEPPVDEATPTSAPSEVPATPVEHPVETPIETTTAETTLPLADGFEGDLSAWAGEGAAIEPGTGTDASAALRLQSTGSGTTPGSPSYVQIALPPGELTVHLAFDLRATLLDPGGTRIATFGTAEGSGVAAAYVLPDGTVGIRFGAEESLTPIATIDPATWTRLELSVAISGNQATVTAWVGGNRAGQVIGSTTASAVGTVALGGWATDRTYSVLIDNVGLDRTCVNVCPPASEPAQEPTPEAELPEDASPVAA